MKKEVIKKSALKEIEKTGIIKEGSTFHVGLSDSVDHSLFDLNNDSSRDLTTEMLDWYIKEIYYQRIANEIDDKDDLSAQFTELWYKMEDGKLIEKRRRIAAYTDSGIRELIDDYARIQKAFFQVGKKENNDDELPF